MQKMQFVFNPHNRIFPSYPCVPWFNSFQLAVSTMTDITYQLEPQLAVDDFIDVLNRSTLGERRPVENRTRMTQMLAGADVICTARDATGKLVGVARALSDRCYATYLADLAVDAACQKQGIGRRLLRECHVAAGLNTMLILLAAPQAQSYYPHIGLTRHDSCWTIAREA